MIITRYEDGYSLQYFEKQAPGRSDFACLFRPNGDLVMYFEPEVALEHYWPRVQAKILDFKDADKQILKWIGEIE